MRTSAGENKIVHGGAIFLALVRQYFCENENGRTRARNLPYPCYTFSNNRAEIFRKFLKKTFGRTSAILSKKACMFAVAVLI